MEIAREQTLQIRTPEGIRFSLLLAGPITRLLAWMLDVVVMVALGSLAVTGFSLLGLISADLGRAVMILAVFVIQIGYGMTCEWFWRGQTFGKRLLRLRVVDAEGLRLQPNQVVIRNLLRFVDLLPVAYFVGGVSCLLTRRAQRLGDLAANTIVIRHPRIREPDLDQLMSGKYNSLRNYPHLAARLRQLVSPAEAKIALQAILRRDEIEASARIGLLAEIAGHLRSVLEFPPEAVEGITDEQYVRNVVDILFRSTRSAAGSGDAPR